MLDFKRKHISTIVESVSHLPVEECSTIASILYAIFEGLGMQKLADPNFDYNKAYETLSVMLGAYMDFITKKRDD